MHVAMLLYDNMTPLDFVGPFQVFAVVPGAKISTVAKRAGRIRIDTGQSLLNADHALGEIERADVLCVPGSIDNSHVQRDEETLDWVRRIDATTTWTTSVCTGSLILAAAGLLHGRRATTHWAMIEQLAAHGAVPVRERVVVDGKYVTGAGVSAGIDMALSLVARAAGDDAAKCVQLAIEYDPQPPFDAGSPAKASPSVTERTMTMMMQAIAASQAA